jgi:hypothetical protein
MRDAFGPDPVAASRHLLKSKISFFVCRASPVAVPFSCRITAAVVSRPGNSGMAVIGPDPKKTPAHFCARVEPLSQVSGGKTDPVC